MIRQILILVRFVSLHAFEERKSNFTKYQVSRDKFFLLYSMSQNHVVIFNIFSIKNLLKRIEATNILLLNYHD